MITLTIISAYLAVIIAVCGFLGSSETLPFGVYQFMVNAMQQWHAFLNDFWPLIPVWEALVAYVIFRFSLVIIKIIFGHRFHHVGPAN